MHREINRLFHNFLAASKTLVDHTRAFLDDFYKGTALQGDFQAYIRAHIADDELCRFVHDLRNYALHRELPVHTMKIAYERDGAITIGVRINTRTLREWNNWTKPAAAFLARQSIEIDPVEIVDGYSERITALHDWLDTKLADFHAADLAEHATLKQRHAALRSARRESAAAAAAARKARPSPLRFALASLHRGCRHLHGRVAEWPNAPG